jgi:hypothetical protein
MSRPAAAIACVVALLGCGHDPGTLPSDGTASDGTASDGASADGPIGPPTASSWLGVNLSGDLPWTDITHQLAPFDTAQRDADGYPAAGASGTSQTDLGFVLPSGTYKISYAGTGALAVGGIAKLDGAWQTVGAEHRATVTITGTPGDFGHVLTLTVTNTGAQTVSAIHLYPPGVEYATPALFSPQLLALLAPFRTLRFMDWENTNASKLTSWTERTSPTQFGTSPSGVAFEHIAELANVTGKDAWITIPEHATDDFIHQLAQLLATKLDFARIATARQAQGIATPFELIVEASNETWNTGFTAFQSYLDAANANPQRYTGVYDGTYGPSFMTSNTKLMRVGQYEADRLVTIGTIFKQELGAHAAAVKPVLSGWALGAAYSDVGLRFIRANHGEPKDYVAYVAQAPYFGPDEGETGSLASLFTSANANVAAMHATFMDFAKLGAEYGIAIAAYEGGQGIGGASNQTIKHLAQHDRRMYDAYNAYFTLWQQDFGKSLFCHFTLAETPGVPDMVHQYGYWGSIISIDEDPAVCGPDLPTLTGSEPVASVAHHCPKYRALAEQALR